MYTALSPIVFATAFILVPSVTLTKYNQCNAESTQATCNDPQSQAITKIMLGVGIGSVAVNTIYIVLFQMVLSGGCIPILFDEDEEEEPTNDP